MTSEQPTRGGDNSWVDLVAADRVPPGTATTIIVDGLAMAVCNDDGRFAVVDNSCPHSGGNLGRGAVRDGRIVCPWHFFEWDLTTGVSPHWPRRLRVYPCRVASGWVQALLADEPEPPSTDLHV